MKANLFSLLFLFSTSMFLLSHLCTIAACPTLDGGPSRPLIPSSSPPPVPLTFHFTHEHNLVLPDHVTLLLMVPRVFIQKRFCPEPSFLYSNLIKVVEGQLTSVNFSITTTGGYTFAVNVDVHTFDIPAAGTLSARSPSADDGSGSSSGAGVGGSSDSDDHHHRHRIFFKPMLSQLKKSWKGLYSRFPWLRDTVAGLGTALGAVKALQGYYENFNTARTICVKYYPWMLLLLIPVIALGAAYVRMRWLRRLQRNVNVAAPAAAVATGRGKKKSSFSKVVLKAT